MLLFNRSLQLLYLTEQRKLNISTHFSSLGLLELVDPGRKAGARISGLVTSSVLSNGPFLSINNTFSTDQVFEIAFQAS